MKNFAALNVTNDVSIPYGDKRACRPLRSEFVLSGANLIRTTLNTAILHLENDIVKPF